MNANEYIEQRLDDQIRWYERKSASNQRWYKRLRLVEFTAAAAIPVMAGYIGRAGSWLPLTIGLLGAVVATIAAALGLYQFEQNWLQYRSTCESLKREKFLYLTSTEPYDDAERANFRLLVQRAETAMSTENANWGQYMRKPGEESEHS